MLRPSIVHPARGDRPLVAVDLRDVQPRHEPQDFRNAGQPGAPDVVARDHVDGRARVHEALRLPRHRRHFQRQEVVQSLGPVRGLLRCRARGRECREDERGEHAPRTKFDAECHPRSKVTRCRLTIRSGAIDATRGDFNDLCGKVLRAEGYSARPGNSSGRARGARPGLPWSARGCDGGCRRPVSPDQGVVRSGQKREGRSPIPMMLQAAMTFNRRRRASTSSSSLSAPGLIQISGICFRSNSSSRR
jgi:hypothetical protein